MSTYERRRQLRETRSAAAGAALFFGVLDVVFLGAAALIAWVFGSSGALFWWIFFVLFVLSALCTGAAIYNYFMSGHDLKELGRR